MPHTIDPNKGNCSPSFSTLYKPLKKAMEAMPPLTSGCNRSLQMSFEDQLKILI